MLIIYCDLVTCEQNQYEYWVDEIEKNKDSSELVILINLRNTSI